MKAAWYPPADRSQDRSKFGYSDMPAITKLLLHSTETSGWPSYPTFAPQFTYDPWKHQWRQHMPLPRSASTLADPSWTAVRENRDDIVQVEIVGYCDPQRWPTYGHNVEAMDDQALRELGEFAAWLHDEWKLPLQTSVQWVHYPASYGLKASQRLSGSQFDAYQGLLGHQHASGNAHGDPGRINIMAIMDAAVKPEEPVNTLRVLTQNGRKSTIDETTASREWEVRLPHMVQHLKNVRPAVVGGQEFTVEQCNDLMEAFPNWTYAGGVKYGNCPIFWDTRKLFAEEGTLLEKRYPSGTRQRYMTLIRLEGLFVDWGAWFASIHLAANGSDEPNSEALRAAQMHAIVEDVRLWIAEHPHLEEGKPNLIVCGDLNDNLGDNAGVRRIAYDRGGWKGLRRRLPLDKITGDTLRSFNGWKSTTGLPHDGKWIDEILTSGVSLEDAALRRTCTDVLPQHASDHNGLAADILI